MVFFGNGGSVSGRHLAVRLWKTNKSGETGKKGLRATLCCHQEVRCPGKTDGCGSSGSSESQLEDKGKSRKIIMEGRKDSENGHVSDTPMWTLRVPGGKYVCGLSTNIWEWRGKFQWERVNLRWSPILSMISNYKPTEALLKNIFSDFVDHLE